MKRSILLSIVIGIFCGMPVWLCAMNEEYDDVEMGITNLPAEDTMPLLGEAEGTDDAVIGVGNILDEVSEEKDKSSMEEDIKGCKCCCWVWRRNPEVGKFKDYEHRGRYCDCSLIGCCYDVCKVAPFVGFMFGGLIYFVVR